MQPLIDFYTQLMGFAGLRVDEKGFIHGESTEANIVQIDGKLLALPTRNQLSKLTSDVEIFHPLSEDTLVKMSKPLSAYIYRLNGKLNTRFAELMVELKNVACSPSKAVELSRHPERLEIVRNIEGTETTPEKDKEFLSFITSRLTEDPSRAFFHIALGRGGMYKGKKQSRVGYVSFPLYTALREDMEKPRKDAKYKSLSKEHCKMIVQMYEAVFPELGVPEEYNYGYESGPYPFFSALMNTSLKLALALNRINEAFEDMFSLEDFEPLQLNWVKTFEDKELLGRLSKMVSNLDQDTEIYRPDSKPATISATPTAHQQVVVNNAVTPVPQQETAKKATASSFDEWMAKKGVPSTMGMHGTVIEVTRKHNEGYRNWFMAFLKANAGMAPANMPHPDQVPSGAMAPPYPGMAPIPQVPGLAPASPVVAAGWGQPVQPAANPWGQPQANAWGQPVAQPAPNPWGQPQVNAWGQPQANAWGQPVAQPAVNPWGHPQANAWGQPVAQPAANPWGQPQVNAWGQPVGGTWGQPQNTSNGVVIPGVV